MKVKVKIKSLLNFKLTENKMKLKCPWPMTAIVSQQTVQKWLWMKERGLVTVRFVCRQNGYPVEKLEDGDERETNWQA